MGKAARIHRVKNTLTEEELLQRLPEITTILDEELQQKTTETFLKGCPDHFWERPSSSTGKYHAEDERGEFGNWIHTKRVFVTYLVVSRTYLAQHLITDYEREAGKSAALLHDMLKYGWPSERREHTSNRHDVIGSNVARDIGGLPEQVWGPIHAHNGAWGEGITPSSDNEQILHMADYVASKPVLGNPKMWNPTEEMSKMYPDIETISDDELEDLL